jgi:hypothetical protein
MPTPGKTGGGEAGWPRKRPTSSCSLKTDVKNRQYKTKFTKKPNQRNHNPQLQTFKNDYHSANQDILSLFFSSPSTSLPSPLITIIIFPRSFFSLLRTFSTQFLFPVSSALAPFFYRGLLFLTILRKRLKIFI